jgi:uncharacterized protein
MATVDAIQWNQLAEPAGPTPLLNHEWLLHLENSGSITPENGWIPRHLTAYEDGALVAAVPLYLRAHSWGEFVFDFAFADVAEKIGVPYYPKLVGMSPATPSAAFAFLVQPGREDELTHLLIAEIERYCEAEAVPVLQFNFVLPPWRERLERYGLVPWEHHGYQWYNEDFHTFDDYLGRFRKGQRRNIRRERLSLARQGLRATIVAATEAPDRYLHRMAQYYLETNAQFGPWAARFLTREFFTTMPRDVRRHVWFAAAEEIPASQERDNPREDPPAGRDPLALAMLVRKGDHLLGRYWGTRIRADNLHFNLCYYTPMEWAIAEGIGTFDPGMGSEHKVRRGFRSIPTFSMHRFFDPHMDAILRANIGRINAMENQQITILDEAVPFRSR